MKNERKKLTYNQRLILNALKEHYIYIGKVLPSALYNIEYEVENSYNWSADAEILETHFIGTPIRSIRFLKGGDPRGLSNYTDEYFFVEKSDISYSTLMECIANNCYAIYKTDKASYAVSVLDSLGDMLADTNVCDRFIYGTLIKKPNKDWETNSIFDDEELEADFKQIYESRKYADKYEWIKDRY